MSRHTHRRPFTFGRSLRSLTGVDERVLDTIGTHRARFTAMGGVVLGTALLAMVSMTVALSIVFDGFPWAGLAIVPVWGWFILNLDRWLMSNTTPPGLGRRVARLLPRLLLAGAVGVVVAEPLLLGVFNSAILERADQNRKNEIVDLQSALLTCNPVPGTEEAARPEAGAARCADLRLSFTGSSLDGKRQELERLKQQIADLQAKVDETSARHAELEFEARKECTGTDGPGLTGEAGIGPNCIRLREQADAYRREQRIDENTAKVGELRAQANTLNGQLGNDATSFAAARKIAIDAELQKARDRQQGVGLLERMRVLSELASENDHAHAAEWALRIFLIIIDALPALVKFLSGYTVYDAAVEHRQERELQAQRAADDTEHMRAGLQNDVSRRHIMQTHRDHSERIALASINRTQSWRIQREAIIGQRVSELIEATPTVVLPTFDLGSGPRSTGSNGHANSNPPPTTPPPRQPSGPRVDR